MRTFDTVGRFRDGVPQGIQWVVESKWGKSVPRIWYTQQEPLSVQWGTTHRPGGAQLPTALEVVGGPARCRKGVGGASWEYLRLLLAGGGWREAGCGLRVEGCGCGITDNGGACDSTQPIYHYCENSLNPLRCAHPSTMLLCVLD